MPPLIDHTHRPSLRSWVSSANEPGSDFPIQNLPLGVFCKQGESGSRIGVAIGTQILDLLACYQVGLLRELDETLQAACVASNLNPLMVLGRTATSALRHHFSRLLQVGEQSLPQHQILVPMAEAKMILPAEIGDYTDFYASIFHATNVGKLFRPDQPLLPNYKHVPIAYHGRASSIVPSDTPVHRPSGQRKSPDASAPSFGLSQQLDYELEMGLFVGKGNDLGKPIAIEQAEAHGFGLCLVNDWSARDIQSWEYQPLGPFLSKSFSTTISPWIVTFEALAPFRCPAWQRDETDPQPLPYLASTENEHWGGIDITVEVWFSSNQMRQQDMSPLRLSQATFKHLYWTFAQMLTHHTSNGCNLRPGDLIASGTVSGPEDGMQGCLLEITQRGKRSISLPTGETRTFLLDGDEVIVRGFCQKADYPRIGFGECRGIICNPVWEQA